MIDPKSNALALLSACSTYAVVLVTLVYAITTSEQRDVMFTQLEEMQRDQKIQRLNKEMDNIVGPLYSRLDDPHIFNPNPLISKFGYVDGILHQPSYEEYVFWEGIKQNKYLTPHNLRAAIDSYLKIRTHSSDPTDQNFITATNEVRRSATSRYDEIVTELSKLE